MKKLILILFIFNCICSFAQKSTPIDYIKQYAPIAQKEMVRSGVPAAITLAQGILESESGNSELALKSNNHFGIKCKNTWQGEKVYHNDDARGECFRKYNKVEESYIDHSDFLKQNDRYSFLFEINPSDYKEWARGLKKAGYATNPFYAHKLIDLIEKYNLQEFNNVEYTENKQSAVNVASIENKTITETATNTVNVSNEELENQNINTIIYVNETKAIKAIAGTSLLAIANKHNLSLQKILEFNDLDTNYPDILQKDDIVFIQRKRKQGAMEFHIVKENETLHDIAQMEGIRLETLLKNNNLTDKQIPAVGEKLSLKNKSLSFPKLLSKK